MDSHKFKKYFFKYFVPIILFFIISTSFFYGWILDSTKPQGGKGWADQTLYTRTAITFAHYELPKKIHYQVGYPLLGALGYYISPDDPFMPISYILLVSSFFLLYFGANNKFKTPFLLLFLLMVFYWDLHARSLHYPSELFFIPWNNQVVFFIFCYYFWLFNYCEDKRIPIWFIIITAFLSGYSIATREEIIFFILPLAISFLVVKKCNYKIFILFFGFFFIGYLPQLFIKYKVLGDILSTGREDETKGVGYISKLVTYFSLKDLLFNSIDIVFDSSIRKLENIRRSSILQSNPWLWLTPFGIFYTFYKKDEKNMIRVYTIISLCLFLFYLAGENMSAHKLKYHCIRYITPSYIAFNFVIVSLFQFLYEKYWEKISKHFLLNFQSM